VLKIRNIGIPEMTVNKQLVNLQRVAFLAMMSYDDGTLSYSPFPHFATGFPSTSIPLSRRSIVFRDQDLGR
jgi:hypothetical protein